MAKHKKQHEEEESSAWEIALADLMTTLMVFFLVMWLTSIVDPAKRQNFIDAINGEKENAANNTLVEDKTTSEKVVVQPIGEPPSTVKPPITPAEIQKTMDKISPKDISIEDTESYTKITLRSDSFFESGRATINDQILEELEKLGESLAGRHQSTYITGYTDNVPIHNLQFPSNWELSAARAASVARTFIYMGVDKKLITIEGRADNDSVAPNTTEYGRSLNRRVEIVLEKPVKKEKDSGRAQEVTKLIPPDKR